MKEKEVLYLEEDDTSQLGANGKQVFVTKRINGKTSHNKSNNEKSGRQLKNKQEEELADNEILIDIDKLYFPDKPEIKNKKRARKNKTLLQSQKQDKKQKNPIQKRQPKNNKNQKTHQKRNKKKEKKERH